MRSGLPGEILDTFAAVRGTVGDVVKRRGDPLWRETLLSSLRVVPPAVTTTLPWMLRAREGRDESLIRVITENARREPHALALEMDDERVSWALFDEKTSRVAHVLAGLGVRPGDVVVLAGDNSPMFLCALFGISRLGATVSLVNHHLESAPLAHAVRTSGARVVIAQERIVAALGQLGDLGVEKIMSFDPGELEERMARASTLPFPRPEIDAASDFVYIFTSGTTGLPKPCRVSHARALLAGAGFGPLLFGFAPGDKLYSVLPLYHSSALLIGVGSCIVTRTPLALRRTFSASAFWPDVRRYGATAMLYIGELCRYLLNSPTSPEELDNSIRVAVGNGLRADVWEPFSRRFCIERIREFYSATEAPGIIANLTGKVGSVGHVPFRRLGSLHLARYDIDRDELVRGADGLCVECEPHEVGELLIKLKDSPFSALGEFKGYTDERATQSKILHDVFKRGDRYFRSGDLMRFDENDYFYFVDRIGDTFRWKGENVSTAEVAEIISRAPGVLGATVTGVHIPNMEGQCGLAALEVEGELDARAFWQVARQLPSYAQPRFVRLLPKLATTGTFKIQKQQLKAEGADPSRVSDPLYLLAGETYVPLTPALWRDVVEGRVRL